MGPGIKRSIVQGFRTANRSWAGVGIYAAGMAGVVIIGVVLAVIGILLTNPPPEVFQEAASTMRPISPAQNAAQPAAPAPQDAAKQEATEAVNLFDQLEETDDAASASSEMVATTVGDSEQEDAATTQAREEQRVRVTQQWFGRAWPVFVVCLFLLLAGNIFLSGGQIGYLAKQVTAGYATVGELWAAGKRAFFPLLGGSLLSLVGIGAFALILLLVSWLLRPFPEGVRNALGLLVVAALFTGLVWAMVRLSFWFIAIVADALTPVAALKASFRMTQGRWWRVAGLGALIGFISYAVSLPFAFFQWLGSTTGSTASLAIGALGSLVGTIVGLYVGFAAIAAYLRFYEDVKAASAASTPTR